MKASLVLALLGASVAVAAPYAKACPWCESAVPSWSSYQLGTSGLHPVETVDLSNYEDDTPADTGLTNDNSNTDDDSFLAKRFYLGRLVSNPAADSRECKQLPFTPILTKRPHEG